jgi:hypothetical protein
MDSSDFLKEDFSESYNQLRHYDSNIFDSFKFIFTIYSALVGGAISLINIDLKYDLIILSKILLIISIVFCFFVMFYIIELRIYYVRVARYLNEIRSFFLSNNRIHFKNKCNFYMDNTKPEYFNIKSSHIILAFIVAALNSFSFGTLLYLFNLHYGYFISLSLFLFIIHIISTTLFLRSRK